MALSSLFGQLIKLKTGAVLFDPPPCEYIIPEPMWDRVNQATFVLQLTTYMSVVIDVYINVESLSKQTMI